jgi:RHS repeat-associated protein
MYNSIDNLIWQVDLDIYGKVHTLGKENINNCPFRYQGQYHDAEIDLYYNRFRYYSAESGTYIRQDPIGLRGRTNIWFSDNFCLFVISDTK